MEQSIGLEMLALPTFMILLGLIPICRQSRWNWKVTDVGPLNVLFWIGWFILLSYWIVVVWWIVVASYS